VLSGAGYLGSYGLRASAPKMRVATPVLTLVDTRTHWDMTRDGQHFLLRQPAGVEQPAFTVILNWQEKLKQRGCASVDASPVATKHDDDLPSPA